MIEKKCEVKTKEYSERAAPIRNVRYDGSFKLRAVGLLMS